MDSVRLPPYEAVRLNNGAVVTFGDEQLARYLVAEVH